MLEDLSHVPLVIRKGDFMTIKSHINKDISDHKNLFSDGVIPLECYGLIF